MGVAGHAADPRRPSVAIPPLGIPVLLDRGGRSAGQASISPQPQAPPEGLPIWGRSERTARSSRDSHARQSVSLLPCASTEHLQASGTSWSRSVMRAFIDTRLRSRLRTDVHVHLVSPAAGKSPAAVITPLYRRVPDAPQPDLQTSRGTRDNVRPRTVMPSTEVVRSAPSVATALASGISGRRSGSARLRNLRASLKMFRHGSGIKTRSTIVFQLK